MIELDKKIEKEILAYCKINNIADVKTFFNRKTREWLNVEIYGDMNEKINKTPLTKLWRFFLQRFPT